MEQKVFVYLDPRSGDFWPLIAPSAWLGKIYSQENIGRVADFGSGPGIPGLVMALVDSNNEYLLIESSGKKVGFMRNVISGLSLGNVKVLSKAVYPVQPDRAS